MKRIIHFMLVLALPLLANPLIVTLAHQPVCEFADLTAEEPWLVPDATISYAYFGSVYPAGDVDYFRFEATEGQSVLLSLSIPAIEDLAAYSPLMTLIGPGLDTATVSQLPDTVEVAAGDGAMMIPLGDEPVYWFEPFGRAYYWNWDNYFFEAPTTSTYTVALWHPENEIGRYSFVIGQREVFGGAIDCFLSYQEYWTPLVEGENPYRDTVIPPADQMQMDDMTHEHSMTMEVDAATAPQVHLQLYPLVDGSFNLRVQTVNFAFTPQNVDMPSVAGEGHAHLYIDDVKTARIYGEWAHLSSLPPDAQTITVKLYTNDHRAFAIDGIPIADSVNLADIAVSE